MSNEREEDNILFIYLVYFFIKGTITFQKYNNDNDNDNTNISVGGNLPG